MNAARSSSPLSARLSDGEVAVAVGSPPWLLLLSIPPDAPVVVVAEDLVIESSFCCSCDVGDKEEEGRWSWEGMGRFFLRKNLDKDRALAFCCCCESLESFPSEDVTRLNNANLVLVLVVALLFSGEGDEDEGLAHDVSFVTTGVVCCWFVDHVAAFDKPGIDSFTPEARSEARSESLSSGREDLVREIELRRDESSITSSLSRFFNVVVVVGGDETLLSLPLELPLELPLLLPLLEWLNILNSPGPSLLVDPRSLITGEAVPAAFSPLSPALSSSS